MRTKFKDLLKSALSIAVVMCCFSCQQIRNDDAKKALFENAKNVNGYEISVIEYDSCEYLVSGMGYSQMMTHKGNCKYCAKRSLK